MITIDKSKCVGCGKCSEVCPTGAIALIGKEVIVQEGRCRACGACVEACPTGAISMMNPEAYPHTIGGFFRHPRGIPFGTGLPRRWGGRHRFGRRRH